jgi:hypothetical protein
MREADETVRICWRPAPPHGEGRTKNHGRGCDRRGMGRTEFLTWNSDCERALVGWAHLHGAPLRVHAVGAQKVLETADIC